MDGLEGVRRDGKEEEAVGREGIQTSKNSRGLSPPFQNPGARLHNTRGMASGNTL